jgi:hypothetical protein
MISNPGTRASDQDRERTAAALGGHYAAGRLTLEEFQERLDQAYAAKTLGELDGLMADLPGTDLGFLLPGRVSLAATRRCPSRALRGQCRLLTAAATWYCRSGSRSPSGPSWS